MLHIHTYAYYANYAYISIKHVCIMYLYSYTHTVNVCMHTHSCVHEFMYAWTCVCLYGTIFKVSQTLQHGHPNNGKTHDQRKP